MNPFRTVNAKPDRNPEQVTRILYRVQDGRLFERTGEKREVRAGEFHWCDGVWSAPMRFQGMEAEGLLTPHVCPIWKLAENQDEPIPQPESPELPKDPIDRLIQRVELTREALEEESVPLLSRIAVLASLYQAKALERIARCLEGKAPVYVGRPDFEMSESRAVCSMCNHGEHARCTVVLLGGHCECPICHHEPTVSSYSLNLLAPMGQHPFEGTPDNHFCTKCGAGRLDRIHA